MINRLKWIERTFEFNFPIEMFPCVIERLRGTPARLEERVNSFSAEMLTRKIDNGWSIQEHVGHLYHLDELHEGRLDDYMANLKVLRPADMTNRKTNEANHNSDSIQNVLSHFRKGRQSFVSRIENLDERKIALVSQHPRLNKPMRLVDMAFFVAEHDDHHIASITELINKLTVLAT